MSRIDDLVAEMCPAGVEFRALGDVFAMKAGSAIPAAAIADVPTDDFTVPCFGGNGIRGYTRSLSPDPPMNLVW